MQLAKCQLADGQIRIGQIESNAFIPLDLRAAGFERLSDLLEAEDPASAAADLPREPALELGDVSLLAPIDGQEVWAAGVTYRRSQVARMEESEASASCYDLVYDSPRPELFFKATASRVVGPGQPVRIRADSKWNVPEPELTLVVVAENVEQACQVIDQLEGNLTGTIYSDSSGGDDADYQRIAFHLRPKVGRMLNDKMPTGVALSSAMNHGGPFPATSHPGFTAVGIPASMTRFAMLQCFDNVRPHRLPPTLRDKNPNGTMWRMLDGRWSQGDVGSPN